MKELARMRLGVLKEIKNMRIFLDNMERTVKNHNPEAIQKAYMFLVHLVYHMDKGCLTPMNIALDVEIGKALNELDEDND